MEKIINMSKNRDDYWYKSWNKANREKRKLKKQMKMAIELITTEMYVMAFGEMRNVATKEDYEKLLKILEGDSNV